MQKTIRLIFLFCLTFTFVIGFQNISHGIGSFGWYKEYGFENKEDYQKPSAIPTLSEIAFNTNNPENHRVKATNALGDLGKESVPVLIKLLDDTDSHVVQAAINGLVKIGPDAKEAGPAAEKTLMSIHPGTRIKALMVIETTGYTSKSLEIILDNMSKNESNRKVRKFARRVQQRVKVQNSIAKASGGNTYTSPPPSELNNIPKFFSIPRHNDLAVIIGIENYQNIKTKADFARNDALLVKEYLLALGFQEKNIEFLVNEKATGSNIRKSIEAWLPNHATKDSRVFIYYSGHGAPDTKGTGYLVPYDGDPSYIKITGYSMNTLLKNLQKIKAFETIVIVDACFSGSGGKSIIPEGTRPLVLEIETPKIENKNIVLMTSSKMNQISTTSKEKQHGLFTYYFLKSLQDGKLTIDDIYANLKDKVSNDAKKMNVEQTPNLVKPVSSTNSKGDFSLR